MDLSPTMQMYMFTAVLSEPICVRILRVGNPERLRHSYWHEGIAVPLPVGEQITHHSSKTGVPTRHPVSVRLDAHGQRKVPKRVQVQVVLISDLNMGFFDSAQLYGNTGGSIWGGSPDKALRNATSAEISEKL